MKTYTLSAGVVVVRFVPSVPQVLLLRAFNHWDFPKGMVEEGEEPFAAAIREVEEETTLTNLNFRWGQEFTETPPYGRGKIARYYLAEWASGEVGLPISAELGKPEHEEFLWTDFAAAHELLTPRVRQVLMWASHRIPVRSSAI